MERFENTTSLTANMCMPPYMCIIKVQGWSSVHTFRIVPAIKGVCTTKCGGGGGSPCRMSIIRNGNVALSIIRFGNVALSNLRKAPAALLNLRKAPVTYHYSLKKAVSPCRFYGSIPPQLKIRLI